MEEQLTFRCPILPNWNMRLDMSCKRYHMCDEEQHVLCGAHAIGQKVSKPYSKSKSCPCKYTSMVPTGDTVMIDGREKRIYLVVCKECQKSRRTVI